MDAQLMTATNRHDLEQRTIQNDVEQIATNSDQNCMLDVGLLLLTWINLNLNMGKYSIMMLVKFSDLSQSDRSNWVM